MSNGRVSDNEFKLDTSGFDSMITKTKNLAGKMANLKDDLDKMKNNIMVNWAGKGRNTFEKKYRLLSQQFGDLRDDLYDISDNFIEMEKTYIQADTDLAKAMDGKDNRY